MTRLELAACAAQLRAEGRTGIEIAEILEISSSYAYSLLTDPDGSKDKERKRRYGGTCEICGAETYGSDGRVKAPKRCMTHRDNQAGPRAWKAKTAPRRDAVIADWNAGVPTDIIASRYGYKSVAAVCQAVGSWRHRGYEVAHRRTPEQVERIAAHWRVAA